MKLAHQNKIRPYFSCVIERLLTQIYYMCKSARRPISDRSLVLETRGRCIQMNVQRMIHLVPRTDPLVQYFDRIVNIVIAAYPEAINMNNAIIFRENLMRFFLLYKHLLIEIKKKELKEN